MNVLLWIILGGVAGWLASVVMKTDTSQSILMDIVMGVLGGLLGGFLMNIFGAPGVTGFNIYSLVVAVIGAVLLTWIGRTLRRSA